MIFCKGIWSKMPVFGGFCWITRYYPQIQRFCCYTHLILYILPQEKRGELGAKPKKCHFQPIKVIDQISLKTRPLAGRKAPWCFRKDQNALEYPTWVCLAYIMQIVPIWYNLGTQKWLILSQKWLILSQKCHFEPSEEPYISQGGQVCL